MAQLRRGLLCLAAVCVLLSLLAVGISAYVVWAEKPRILAREEQPPEALDCILVLGCGLGPDGRPKPMLADRMRVGVTLYQRGWADRLLLSGDNSGPTYNEPGAMKTWALEQGVPEEAILLDNEGFSTAESVERARDVFGMKRLAVVTQEYHLYRALFLADRMGLEPWGVSATLRTYGPRQIIWSAREILARDKDFLRMLTGS